MIYSLWLSCVISSHLVTVSTPDRSEMNRSRRQLSARVKESCKSLHWSYSVYLIIVKFNSVEPQVLQQIHIIVWWVFEVNIIIVSFEFFKALVQIT